MRPGDRVSDIAARPGARRRSIGETTPARTAVRGAGCQVAAMAIGYRERTHSTAPGENMSLTSYSGGSILPP